jgi:hypothetical protein
LTDTDKEIREQRLAVYRVASSDAEAARLCGLTLQGWCAWRDREKLAPLRRRGRPLKPMPKK